MNADDPLLSERLREAASLLAAARDDEGVLNTLPEQQRRDFINLCGDVFQPDPVLRRRHYKQRAKRLRDERRAKDEAVLGDTGIRRLRARDVFTTPNVHPPYSGSDDRLRARTLDPATDGPAPTSSGSAAAASTIDEQHCYICKAHYTDVHHFYDQLCPECAPLNFAKRTETADLSGRVALLTGGRVKIGYQTGIKLLRAGAHLIVTTRFPRDAAERYAREGDADDWTDRLEIHGVDLRHTPSVEALCTHLVRTHDRLDFIINNACQTVRRPPAFYEHMLEGERALTSGQGSDQRALLGGFEGVRAVEILRGSGTLAGGVLDPVELSQAVLVDGEDQDTAALFPAGQLDKDLQQVDLRDRNSWRLLLDEVSSVELLEVQLVNAVAPFLINARLKPLMTATPERDKHIVNVSAVEGQFYRPQKTTRHPHTNMAKAALNMMTRTSATDYHGDGIHMNAVDTGWVTDEDPVEIAERKTDEHRFHPPLDIVDGAARIVDPIIDGFNTGSHTWGKFLKDYHPTDW